MSSTQLSLDDVAVEIVEDVEVGGEGTRRQNQDHRIDAVVIGGRIRPVEGEQIQMLPGVLYRGLGLVATVSSGGVVGRGGGAAIFELEKDRGPTGAAV